MAKQQKGQWCCWIPQFLCTYPFCASVYSWMQEDLFPRGTRMEREKIVCLLVGFNFKTVCKTFWAACSCCRGSCLYVFLIEKQINRVVRGTLLIRILKPKLLMKFSHVGERVWGSIHSHSVENQHTRVSTVTFPIEFVETLAQNRSYQALGTTWYLQAEVSNSLF